MVNTELKTRYLNQKWKYKMLIKHEWRVFVLKMIDTNFVLFTQPGLIFLIYQTPTSHIIWLIKTRSGTETVFDLIKITENCPLRLHFLQIKLWCFLHFCWQLNYWVASKNTKLRFGFLPNVFSIFFEHYDC